MSQPHRSKSQARSASEVERLRLPMEAHDSLAESIRICKDELGRLNGESEIQAWLPASIKGQKETGIHSTRERFNVVKAHVVAIQIYEWLVACTRAMETLVACKCGKDFGVSIKILATLVLECKVSLNKSETHHHSLSVLNNIVLRIEACWISLILDKPDLEASLVIRSLLQCDVDLETSTRFQGLLSRIQEIGCSARVRIQDIAYLEAIRAILFSKASRGWILRHRDAYLGVSYLSLAAIHVVLGTNIHINHKTRSFIIETSSKQMRSEFGRFISKDLISFAASSLQCILREIWAHGGSKELHQDIYDTTLSILQATALVSRVGAQVAAAVHTGSMDILVRMSQESDDSRHRNSTKAIVQTGSVSEEEEPFDIFMDGDQTDLSAAPQRLVQTPPRDAELRRSQAFLKLLAESIHALRMRNSNLSGSFEKLVIFKSLVDDSELRWLIPHVLDIDFYSSDQPSGPDMAVGLCRELLTLIREGQSSFVRASAVEVIITLFRDVLSGISIPSTIQEDVLDVMWDRWEEPNCKIHFALRDLLDVLISKSKALLEDVRQSKWWKLCKQVLLRSPWARRSKYYILYSFLAIIPSRMMLEMCPTLLTQAIMSMDEEGDNMSSIHDFLTKFWNDLYASWNSSMDTFYRTSAIPILDCYLHMTQQAERSSHVLRNRIANVTLVSFIKTGTHKSSSQDHINYLLRMVHANDVYPLQTILPTIYSAARKCGLIVSLDEDICRQGLHMADTNTSIAIVEVIAGDGSSSIPCSKFEMSIMLKSTSMFLASNIDAHIYSRYRHAVKRFLERLHSTWKSALSGGGYWKSTRGDSDGSWDRKEYSDCVSTFVSQMTSDLFQMILPSMSRFRIRHGLDLLHFVLLFFGDQSIQVDRTCLHNTLYNLLRANCDISRQKAYQILAFMNPPLSGMQSVEELNATTKHLLNGLSSSRIRECDALCLHFRILVRKCVVESGMWFRIHSNLSHNSNALFWKCTCLDASPGGLCFGSRGSSLHPESNRMSWKESVISMILIVDWVFYLLQCVREELDFAGSSFVQSCSRGLVHGKMLLLNHLLEEILGDSSSRVNLENLLCTKISMDENERILLLETVQRLSDLLSQLRGVWQPILDCAMRGIAYHEPNVSAVQEYAGTSSKESGSSGDDEERSSSEIDTGLEESMDHRVSQSFSDQPQRVITSCFLSIKEVMRSISLVLSKWPSVTKSNWAIEYQNEDSVVRCAILDPSYYTECGAKLHHILTQSRHTGVCDHASVAFQVVCEELRTAYLPELRSLPHEWLTSILQSALAGDLYVLRRSRGFTALVISNLRSERTSDPFDSTRDFTLVMESTMKFLEDHICAFGIEERCGVVTVSSAQAATSTVSNETGLHALQLSKLAVAGSHCLNILRVVFQDALHGQQAMPYVGRALEISMRIFSSNIWIVRNSASMLFASLCRKIGKGQDSSLEINGYYAYSGAVESARPVQINGNSGREFFSRYPTVYKYLQEEMQIMVRGGEWETSQKLYLAFLVLSLLSPAQDEVSSDVSLNVFVNPLIRFCGARRGEVRSMIAAACVPLVESEQLLDILKSILEMAMAAVQQGQIRNNTIHGCLVLFATIVNSHRALLSTDQKAQNVVSWTALFPMLGSRLERSGSQISPWSMAIYCQALEAACWLGYDAVVGELDSSRTVLVSTAIVIWKEAWYQCQRVLTTNRKCTNIGYDKLYPALAKYSTSLFMALIRIRLSLSNELLAEMVRSAAVLPTFRDLVRLLAIESPAEAKRYVFENTSQLLKRMPLTSRENGIHYTDEDLQNILHSSCSVLMNEDLSCLGYVSSVLETAAACLLALSFKHVSLNGLILHDLTEKTKSCVHGEQRLEVVEAGVLLSGRLAYVCERQTILCITFDEWAGWLEHVLTRFDFPSTKCVCLQAVRDSNVFEMAATRAFLNNLRPGSYLVRIVILCLKLLCDEDPDVQLSAQYALQPLNGAKYAIDVLLTYRNVVEHVSGLSRDNGMWTSFMDSVLGFSDIGCPMNLSMLSEEPVKIWNLQWDDCKLTWLDSFVTQTAEQTSGGFAPMFYKDETPVGLEIIYEIQIISSLAKPKWDEAFSKNKVVLLRSGSVVSSCEQYLNCMLRIMRIAPWSFNLKDMDPNEAKHMLTLSQCRFVFGLYVMQSLFVALIHRKHPAIVDLWTTLRQELPHMAIGKMIPSVLALCSDVLGQGVFEVS